MKLFLTLAYNQLFCSIITIFYFVVKKLLKNKIPHYIFYYSEIIIMTFFMIPLYKFIPYSKKDAALTFHNRTLLYTENIINTMNKNIILSNNTEFSCYDIALLLYLIIIIFILCYISQRNIVMMKMINRQKKHADFPFEDFRELKIFYCPIISTPILIGIFKPQLLLPNNVLSSEIKFILKHELIHKKRNDIFIKYITTLIAVFNWINPLLWLLLISINKECEISCDECCIRSMKKEDKVHYAHILISYAEKQTNLYLSFGLTFFGTSGLLKERVNLIMEKTKKKALFTVLFIILFTAIISIGTYFICEISLDTLRGPVFIIENYVNNPKKYMGYATKEFLNPEFISKVRCIDVKSADEKYASIHKVNYSGEYSSVRAYTVKYEIEYKDDYAYMMTEKSGVKEKLFILVNTDNGWVIDEVGY